MTADVWEWVRAQLDELENVPIIPVGIAGPYAGASPRRYVAAQDPAAVLRLVAMARGILDLHPPGRMLAEGAPDFMVESGGLRDEAVMLSRSGVEIRRMPIAEFERVYTVPAPPDPEVLWLASLFADRPGYDAEGWKP